VISEQTTDVALANKDRLGLMLQPLPAASTAPAAPKSTKLDAKNTTFEHVAGKCKERRNFFACKQSQFFL
jgi:hypothetical protein